MQRKTAPLRRARSCSNQRLVPGSRHRSELHRMGFSLSTDGLVTSAHEDPSRCCTCFAKAARSRPLPEHTTHAACSAGHPAASCSPIRTALCPITLPLQSPAGSVAAAGGWFMSCLLAVPAPIDHPTTADYLFVHLEMGVLPMARLDRHQADSFLMGKALY